MQQMRLTNNFFKLNNTYIKYFLSYLLIITVLAISFLIIVKTQILRHFFDQRCAQAQTQLDIISTQLNTDVSSLSIIDSYLESDFDLIKFRHSASSYTMIQAFNELKEYAATSPMISSIIYLSPNNDTLLSTQYPAFYEEGIFQIGSAANEILASFDPSSYYSSTFAQLISIPAGSSQQLLYFPTISSTKNCTYFYILDNNYFVQQFMPLLTDETPAIALINKDKEIITGLQTDLISPYLETLPLENGIISINSSVSICVHTDIIRDFSMVFLLSNDTLHSQINAAFAKSYLTIVLVSFAGILLILLSMRITYLPLHKLAQQVLPNPNHAQNYFHQIESTFKESKNEIHYLKDKLENYQTFMHRSLFESIVPMDNTANTALPFNIDNFFAPNACNWLFVLQIRFTAGTLSWEELQHIFLSTFPEDLICILLGSEQDNITFLVNHTGDDKMIDVRIKNLCYELHEERGILSVVSVGSDSLLDLPSLRENVSKAVPLLKEIPVVDLSKISVLSETYSYPHQQLSQLFENLTQNHFHAAGKVLDELFVLTDHYASQQGKVPRFLLQCIIIDMLTVIINYMNASYIKFHTYSNTYFETLFFCRSCPYEEKAEAIAANMHHLVDLCEQKIAKTRIDSEQLLQIIRESYCQPDFSITTLADRFNISASYMSLLFKQELHMNFSDYLTELRLNKAKELLRTTDMPVEEISITVGYTSATGFGRKFKQEVGMTPSQYRMQELYASSTHSS